MKCFRKFICFGLATIMMCTVGQPVYASNNEDSYTQVSEINDIEMPEDSAVNYTEQREDGLYYITEKINGSNIESTFYKIDGEEKILESSILSTVQEGKVTCIETNSNGDVEQYTISVDQEDLIQAADNEKLARSKTYLRTDKYGISLVGKKSHNSNCSRSNCSSNTICKPINSNKDYCFSNCRRCRIRCDSITRLFICNK